MNSAQGPPNLATAKPAATGPARYEKLQAGRGERIGAIEGGVVHQVRHKRPYPSRGCRRERSGQRRQHEDVPELQPPQRVECGNRCDERRPGEVVEAHHQPRLVAIQQTPEDRPGGDAGEVEAEG